MVELKIGELKALIREYNKTMQKEQHITPSQLKGKSKDEILKVISDLGYTVDHEKRMMKRTKKGEKDKKKRPMTVKLPPPKTEEEKKKEKEERVKKKEEKDKKKKEEKDEIIKGTVALSKLAAKRKERKEKGKKKETKEAGTQTEDKKEEKKEMSDEELLKHYGHYRVNKLNEILDSIEDKLSKGGGSKLSKIKKIIKHGGVKKLKKAQ
jgi:hypothetical protein